ncbi:Eco57I restriction-modification methylase domain-containing protein [Telluribacter sp. SYSU D00476]|uniref:type IIG restriction enzyme/methyltransferase n=1 Tax=Telluribacter sp. SYSU D00476 TaxID=2811430 RepID=UPI001FF5FAF3|nr:hypothetical protein [Telluribacter sp. SYSU D00476]
MINEEESEENVKIHLMDFLKNTYYRNDYLIATKGRTDFVVHLGKEATSPVGVLFEVKRPKNHSEMVSRTNLNTKAMHELLLYYLRERLNHNNTSITHLVITNIYEWYIFDAQLFERLFFNNSFLVKEFKAWQEGRKVNPNNEGFYRDIAKVAIDKLEEEVPFTHFDIRTYRTEIENDNQEDDKRLIGLYKVFSPVHLLKLPSATDANKLNDKFYSELLYIIGLEEAKEAGKKVIRRKQQRDEGSLIENTICTLDTEGRLSHIGDLLSYGVRKDEQYFNVALELTITWINRILFLKLLEAQLLKYHSGNTAYGFLNERCIKDYDVLNKLFFQVLARPTQERSEAIRKQFGNVPYLNSSLFDISPLEDDTIRINSLDNTLTVPLPKNSVLRKNPYYKNFKQIGTLHYLFAFLDAYDFSSENKEDIIEENKELISASVLGLIFEKINGYKDGSFYTPAFITEYMSRETIRRAILQKFKEVKGWSCTSLDELYNKIDDIQEANTIFDSLKICDPAVGSGHFLVSALNELIYQKCKLGILADQTGRRLKGYSIDIVNDELIIRDTEEEVFEYKVLSNGKVNPEVQRVQETLFHQKQSLIENCLFGVDINPNSVKICRLRLWIELLKNSYYTSQSLFQELETLPNIDINIKQGNSLLSRYSLTENLREVFEKQKFNITTYKNTVQAYKDSKSKEAKVKLLNFINEIKEQFRQSVVNRDPRRKKLSDLRGQRMLLDNNIDLFGGKLVDEKLAKVEKKRLDMLIAQKEQEIESIENNSIYKGSLILTFLEVS